MQKPIIPHNTQTIFKTLNSNKININSKQTLLLNNLIYTNQNNFIENGATGVKKNLKINNFVEIKIDVKKIEKSRNYDCLFNKQTTNLLNTNNYVKSFDVIKTPNNNIIKTGKKDIVPNQNNESFFKKIVNKPYLDKVKLV